MRAGSVAPKAQSRTNDAGSTMRTRSHSISSTSGPSKPLEVAMTWRCSPGGQDHLVRAHRARPRASMEEAQVATGHFLGTLAEAVSDAAQSRGTFEENDPEARTLWR